MNPTLKKGTKLLTEKDNPAGRILDPIYSGKVEDGVNYILYNDQVPDGPTTTTRGHTKGMNRFFYFLFLFSGLVLFF